MDISWLIHFPLILALYIFSKHFFNKLRNLPPSPILNLPLIGHLHLLKKPLYRSLSKISDRYGPVVLLQFGARRVLIVSSPSAVEECLTKNDIVFANRPQLLAGKYIGNNYTSLAWASYGDNWRNLRKIASIEVLSAHRLQMLHGIRVDEVKSTISILNRAAEVKRAVDMKTVFFELTMNVMMRMIAGKKYYGENVEDLEEAKRFRSIANDTMKLATSNIGDFLPVVRWLGVGGVEKRLAELVKRREAFLGELVEECRERFRSHGGGGAGERETKAKSMIEVLLMLQEKEPKYYTDGFIGVFVLVSIC